MQQSTQRVYILRGAQRRCVWVVGRLGVAACLACVAAAVDRQARQLCRVWLVADAQRNAGAVLLHNAPQRWHRGVGGAAVQSTQRN